MLRRAGQRARLESKDAGKPAILAGGAEVRLTPGATALLSDPPGLWRHLKQGAAKMLRHAPFCSLARTPIAPDRKS